MDDVVGSCRVLGGGSGFYLCPPGFAMTHPAEGPPYRVELTGRAVSSNGRREFVQPGASQVSLKNGRAFGPESGVDVSGRIKPGSIVMFSYAPKPLLNRGFAVWKLRRPASHLRLRTLAGARQAELLADGTTLRAELMIAPATEIHDSAIRHLFAKDMQHLMAIANGDPNGACRFFKPSHSRVAESEDECARIIGLPGRAAAIKASITTASFSAYNGYVVAQTVIEQQALVWILDQGHFRSAYGYKLI